jgi:hypothetical protein
MDYNINRQYFMTGQKGHYAVTAGSSGGKEMSI